MASKEMLRGYRVLDFTQFVAGPTCGRMLAEMGAEVIKIELAPYGDRSRMQGLWPRKEEFKRSSMSTYFFQHNHSKKSFAVNIKSEDGRELVRELVKTADVVIENFTPGVMERYGLGYDDLKKINPSIVMCSISLAGQSGPLSSRPGYDYIGAAYAGVAGMVGEADGPPAQLTLAIGDVSAGITAAMGVGFALLHRERTGEGQHLDASLIDTYFQMHEANVPKVAIRGDAFMPTRSGSRHPDGGPVGYLRCADGRYISLCVLAPQWPGLCAAMGQPELADDPRFNTPLGRRDNGVELDGLIEQWLATLPDRDTAIRILEEHRVPVAPVLTLNEAIEQPHLRERQTVRGVEDEQIGKFAIPGMPVKFSAWRDAEELHADMLGEHNDYVLKELLGHSPEEIAKLHEEGIVVQDPLVGQKVAAGGKG